MARPNKKTVDYFPHYAKAGRTVFILESKYGNDGYAFWFKLLELLCDTDGHSYDCTNSANWEFLLAKTKVTEESANNILETLSTLGKIDAELWRQKVIWVDNLVKNLSEVYARRSAELPKKPEFPFTETAPEECLCIQESPKTDETTGKNRQSKVKESKGEESKGEDMYPYQEIADLWNSTCSSMPKVVKLTEARKKKIKARCEDWGKSTLWLDRAKNIFERMQASDFLCGDNKSKWVATFDWIIESPSNWVKVMEGNYDNNRSTQMGAFSSPLAGRTPLGAGEYISADGKRTYGSGKAVIPDDAPPRPSERYTWNAAGNNWILL